IRVRARRRRRGRPRRWPVSVESGAGPLLVGAAVAGPDVHLGAVGGAVAADVQALVRAHGGDAAVGVQGPSLVVLAVAVPDDHRGAVGRAGAVHVQALAAVHAQLTGAGGGPLLVGAAVAVPDVHLGAVGLGGAVDVQAPVRPDAPEGTRVVSRGLASGPGGGDH